MEEGESGLLGVEFELMGMGSDGSFARSGVEVDVVGPEVCSGDEDEDPASPEDSSRYRLAADQWGSYISGVTLDLFW